MHDHWEDGVPTYVQVEAERLIEHPNCTSQRGRGTVTDIHSFLL